jgi:hypothetical protein
LCKVSDVGFAADYKAWDSTISSDLIFAAIEVVNRWYDDEHAHFRRKLGIELCGSYIAVGKDIYRKFRGIPSGVTGTSEFNSLVNMIVTRYVWVKLASIHAPNLRGVSNVNVFVRSYFYGDDNIHSVKKEVEWFNARNFAKTVELIGLKMTRADKVEGDLDENLVPIDELTFLKRGFRMIEGLGVMAPLEIGVIESMVMFQHQNGNDVEAELFQIIEAAFREAMRHGEIFFNDFKGTMLKFKTPSNFNLPTQSYKELFDDWVINLSKGSLPLDTFCELTFDEAKKYHIVVNDNKINCGLSTTVFDKVVNHIAGNWFLPVTTVDAPRRNIGDSSSAEGLVQCGIARSDLKIIGPANSKSQTTKIETAEVVSDSVVIGKWQKQVDAELIWYPRLERSFADELTKGQYQQTVLWTNSTPINQPMTDTITLPPRTTTNPQNVALTCYNFIRTQCIVDIQCNGTPFHQGKMCAYFTPQMDYFSENNDAVTSTIVTARGHVMIDASKAGTYRLEVPFENTFEAFRTTATSSGLDSTLRRLGNIRFVCLSSLNFASGTTASLPITVYVSYKNPMVRGPCPTHTVGWAQGGGVEDILSPAVSCLSDGAVSIGNGTASIHYGNLDNPVRLDNSQVKLCGDFPHGRGVSSSTVIDIAPFIYTPSDKKKGCDPDADEMDIKRIIQIPTWYNSVAWTTSTAQGTNLYNFALTPAQFENKSAPALSGGVQVASTPLGYISRIFSMWRGSFNLGIEIVSTAFHRGRLLVAYINDPAGTGATLSQAINYPHYILDIQEKKSFTMNFPWFSETPYKYITMNGNQDTTNIFSLGFVNIYVLNTLCAPSNVPPTIDVAFYISAGSDFEFKFPSRTVDSVRFLGKAQSGDLNEGTVDKVGEVRVDRSSGIGDIATVSDSYVSPRHLPTYHMDMRDLIRRRSYLAEIELPVTADLTRFLMVNNTPLPRWWLDGPTTFDYPSPRVSSALEIFTSMYRFWRGSLRYTIVTNANKNVKALCFPVFTAEQGSVDSTDWQTDTQKVPSSAWAASMATSMSSVCNLASDPIIDVTVPYFGLTSRLLTQNQGPDLPPADPLPTQPETMMMCNGTTEFWFVTDTALKLYLYVSAGDDFELSGFMGPPRHFDNRATTGFTGKIAIGSAINF